MEHTRQHAKAVGALGALLQALQDTDPDTATGLEALYEAALQSPPPGALFEPEVDDATWEGWEFEGTEAVGRVLS